MTAARAPGSGQPGVAVDVLTFSTEKGQLKLLLTRRQQPPYEGRWAIPGVRVGMAESTDAAAIRACAERAGLSGIYMEQLYTFSDPDRDPRSRTISVAYLALAPVSRLRAAVRPGEVELFDVMREGAGFRLAACGGGATAQQGAAMPELAFDHAAIIATALNRMAGKLEYTDIGSHCLEDRSRFTLSELCEIYAAIAGRSYDLPNFRRFIKKRYEVTGRIEPTGERLKKRGTPAVVYRWKEDEPWNGC